MKALAHALYFGILGPYFGGIFVAATNLRSDASNFATQLILAVVVGIGIWPVAVLFGGIPATTTGLIYWALKTRTRMIALGRIRVALIMFIVGGMCAGFFWLVIDQPLSQKKVVDAFVFFVFPGGGASAICALLLQPRARPPNKVLEQTGDA